MRGRRAGRLFATGGLLGSESGFRGGTRSRDSEVELGVGIQRWKGDWGGVYGFFRFCLRFFRLEVEAKTAFGWGGWLRRVGCGTTRLRAVLRGRRARFHPLASERFKSAEDKILDPLRGHSSNRKKRQASYTGGRRVKRVCIRPRRHQRLLYFGDFGHHWRVSLFSGLVLAYNK